MTKKELIRELEKFDDYTAIICKDEFGTWDNIDRLEKDGCCVVIVFGGGSQFSGEK